MEYSFFDMHLHSTASDGTDTPAQIVEKIKSKAIKTFSLTDHDNVEGVREILNFCDLSGVDFYRGIEFSCRTGKICHILGYGIDIDSPDIERVVQTQKQLHDKRMERRIKALNEMYGISFQAEELKWLSRQNRAGKPHLAQLLVKQGYANSTGQAFENYLNNIHSKVEDLNPKDAIDAIKKANGLAIWAHPLGGEGETHLDSEGFLQEARLLQSYGIDGIECFYSRYSDEEIEFLLKFAKENNLLISGGSDYHGKNKDIFMGQLGAHTPQHQQESIEKMLKLLKQRDI